MVQQTLSSFHRQIYKSMKKSVANYFGPKSSDLIRYEKDHRKEAKRKTIPSNLKELSKSIQNSQVVFLGDFHTFDQYTKNLNRICRELQKGSQSFCIALEMVFSEHQHFLDAFTDGVITESELLESIDYRESWRFPWNHYRELFIEAKNQGRKLIALNSKGDLPERDQHAAFILNQYLEKANNEKCLVLFGEYHIIHNKLPKLLQAQSNSNRPFTIIHQNLDHLYWRLNDQDQKQVLEKTVVRTFNKNEFALITSPPWVKYESLLYWIEGMCEDPDFDFHNTIFDTGLKILNSNVQSHFAKIVKDLVPLICPDLDIESLSDFEIYDATKIDQLLKRSSSLEAKWKNFVQKSIERNEPFKYPGKYLYYCPHYSFHRLGLMAGLYIGEKILDSNLKKKKRTSLAETSEIFTHFFFCELFGLLSSKIINPHIKWDLFQDIADEMVHTKDPKRKETLKAAIDLCYGHLDFLRKSFSPHQLREIARIFSKIVAHNIFSDINRHGGLWEMLYDVLIQFDSLEADHLIGHFLFILESQGFEQQKKVFI